VFVISDFPLLLAGLTALLATGRGWRWPAALR
jgi:hypothetical protein